MSKPVLPPGQPVRNISPEASTDTSVCEINIFLQANHRPLTAAVAAEVAEHLKIAASRIHSDVTTKPEANRIDVCAGKNRIGYIRHT